MYLNDFIILYLINRDNIITNNQLTYTLNDTTYRINKKDGDIWLITKLPNDSFHINIFDIGNSIITMSRPTNYRNALDPDLLMILTYYQMENYLVRHN